ncbi:hypothetical protein [Paenibacillus typhae]|uniref:hypothetical protein n=1 Tax=Paenibacillus typhae TaxID=1174501 RepID=UPI000AD822E4
MTEPRCGLGGITFETGGLPGGSEGHFDLKANPCFSQPSYPSVLAKASPAAALSVSTDYKAFPQCAIVAA